MLSDLVTGVLTQTYQATRRLLSVNESVPACLQENPNALAGAVAPL